MAKLAPRAKRDKQNERNRTRNRFRKSVLKTETKKFLDAIHNGDLDAAQEMFAKVTKRIDQTAAKGTLHKGNAARKKSRLAKRLVDAKKAVA